VRQLGRKVGDDILQYGEPAADGSVVRWAYREIARDSFLWCNEVSRDGGTTWTRTQDMQARRIS
jgi:hypothetical protein